MLRDLKMKFDTGTMLATLTENREKHMATYMVALKEWERQVKVYLTKLFEHFDSESPTTPSDRDLIIPNHYPRPVCYATEYDRVIDMLTQTTDDSIELDSVTYDKLMHDKWEWTEAWAVNTLSYSNTEAVESEPT